MFPNGSNVVFSNLNPGILAVENNTNKVVTVPASSFISSSSTYITPDWNNNTEGTNGYIDNKPLISSSDGTTFIGHGPSYEDFSQVLITDDVNAKGNLVLGTNYVGDSEATWKRTRIYGEVEIYGGEEEVHIGSSQRNKDLTVNGDVTITGNVSLGTEASDTAKTITLGSTTGAGNVADTINVNGTTTINGNLTIGTGSSITTPSAGISSAQIGLLSLGNLTANSILKLDSQKHVVSDTGTYMKFRSEVNTYDDLSNISEPIAVGDVFYIKDTDSQVVATEITSDKNLRVIYSTDINVTLNTDSEGITPILSTSDFFSAFSTDGAFDTYPTFAYTYHKIYYNGSNVGDLKIVPVRTSEYGIIIALVSVTASKAWAASTTYDGGERNVWYIEGMLSNGSGVVELDVTHSTIPSGRNIKEFVVFGGGVTWKSIGRKTTNIINMIPITEDTEYAEIESILLAGNIPYLYSMDSNCKYGNQYHFCGGYTANSIDYYTFESVTYDNGSFKKVIKICEEATDPTWTTKTVTLTIDA